MRKRSHCQESDPGGENVGEDITEVKNGDMENTNTVDILGTGMVEAAVHKVGKIHHRFCIVSSVQGEHDCGQHGQVGGGQQQGGRE